MRVLILGIGGVGAMAAWRLARAGHEVIGFEQFGLDHDLGSSYGDSRIVRRVYPDTLYTGLMADAYALWDELQAQTSEGIVLPGGRVLWSRPTCADRRRRRLCRRAAWHMKFWTRRMRTRFPGLSSRAQTKSPSTSRAWDMPAPPAVCGRRRDWRDNTAQPCANTRPLAHLKRIRNGVRVNTQAGEIVAGDRLLLTAGPWTGPRLAAFGVSVPLVVTRQAYIHLEPRHAEVFETGQFPVWIDAATNFYGFPRLGDVPGVKIALHEYGRVTTPETVQSRCHEADIEATRHMRSSVFPGLARK